jgi:hypothetical protein
MKKHDILTQTESALSGLPQTAEPVVGGRAYKLRLLSRAEETRARGVITSENLLTAFADSNVPQLGYAVVSIDGVPQDQLFEPDTDEEKSDYAADPVHWRALQTMQWLSQRPTIVVEQLWLAYLQLKDKAAKSMKDMEDFSKRTPSGD